MLLILDRADPLYYGISCFRKDNMIVGLVEVDLSTFRAKQIIGVKYQDWDDLEFIILAERHGAKGLMRGFPNQYQSMDWRRIPNYAYVDEEGLVPQLYTDINTAPGVYREVILDQIIVNLDADQAAKSHLIHPNCTIRFI